MTFKTKEREVGKNVMCRKIVVDVLQCDAMCSLNSALLAEVGSSPYANRRAAVEQGIFLHLSRVLTELLSFPSRKRGKMI